MTVETTQGGRRLAVVDAIGEAAGLRSGQTLTDACALCPGLGAVEADPAADATALAAIAAWCERYTPLAAPAPPDGLWLDITGCAHLFGGEEAMARDLTARLHRQAIPSCVAIAGTPGAAWGLSRAHPQPSPHPSPASGRGGSPIIPPGRERDALAGLPLAALRLDTQLVAGLRRLGLRTVAELARLQRGDVTARFGPLPVLRLDQAFGGIEESIAWLRPPAPWSERLAFAEPIGTPEDLVRAVSVLAERLCARLAEKDQGGRHFVAHFYRVDGAIPSIAVTTALPARDPVFLAKLMREKLETVDPGYGIEVIAIEAAKTATMKARQAKLTHSASLEPASDVAVLVDTLSNRFGPERVWRVAPHGSHVPEQAVRRIPPLADPRTAWVNDPSTPRPIRLLVRPEMIEVTAPVPDDPPLQFRWRGVLHRVRAATGPERIAAEWWRQPRTEDGRAETDLMRDYYRAEDMQGTRFWLFRTGLHGLRKPRWYLHGVFA